MSRKAVFIVVATAALLAACSSEKSDLQAAIKAGQTAVSTARTCVDHIKAHRNADIPQCDATREFKAFEDARKKLKKPLDPAVKELDQQLKAIQKEALDFYKSSVAR